jgi:hypothetical protein
MVKLAEDRLKELLSQAKIIAVVGRLMKIDQAIRLPNIYKAKVTE